MMGMLLEMQLNVVNDWNEKYDENDGNKEI